MVVRRGTAAILYLSIGLGTAVGAEKKLIEWGWDQPTAAYLREHIRAMEERPFDGVVLDVKYRRDGKDASFAWTCFGRERIEPAAVSRAIADLQATAFRRFTDNFLRFNTCPGDVDLFGDWSAIVANAALGARIAREGALKGWMFDVEQYNRPLWEYGKAEHRADRSFGAYARQARIRGRAVMRAVAREYPDIVILLTFGHSLIQAQVERGKRPEEASYALLPAFLDGMIEEAPPTTTIVDAFEMAYPYTERGQFLEAFHLIRSRAAAQSADPDRYRRAVRAGFGLWIDHDWRGRGWHTEPGAFAKNLRTPEGLETALREALSVSDRYVWLYSEKLNWWTGKNVPAAYLEAVARARRAIR